MTQYYPCKILKRHFKYCTLIILNNRCGIVKCPHRASCAVFSVKIYIQQGLVICCCLVAKSCLTLCDPLDHSPPGSSVQGILQARILEWEAISYSRGSSLPRDRNCISCIGSVQFSSAQILNCSVVSDCDPMDCSMPGLPVHHQLPQLTQTQFSSQWYHSTVSSSVSSFSSGLQSVPVSGSFQMSQFFTSGGQRIAVSASASVLPIFRIDFL